jgi:hypothetical protein
MHDRKHILARLIKFVVVDDNTYVSFNMIYYNGMNLKKKKECRCTNWDVVYITVHKPLKFFFLLTKHFVFLSSFVAVQVSSHPLRQHCEFLFQGI